jgi:hypothetical protein
MQNSLGFEELEAETSKLNVVYAQYQRSEPFSLGLFQGFSSLRVLTYSASVNFTVRMLNLFETVECVFGYEGVLQDFSDILACQKTISENLLVAVKGLDDARKQFILEKHNQGKAHFYVVKDAVSHSKIYLLEGPNTKRVIVGSANLSERAFSGKQHETIIAYDNDEAAWVHYLREYQNVKRTATSEISLPETSKTVIALEDISILQEAQKAKNGLTIFTNIDLSAVSVPTITRTIEKLSASYRPLVQPVVAPKNGRFVVNREVVGKIVHLVKSQKREDHEYAETWFSIQRDARKVFLSGTEISLRVDREQLNSDIACIVQYFENFNNGFHGDVVQHQKDYFMFMSWLYFSPFVCDFRNQAIAGQDYIFDFPLFAVLYGKSNCGKTRLVETLMKSMFGHWQFVDKVNFTRTNLRGLLQTYKRFPVVFDDVEKKRFTDHATDIIKDETFMLPEYPAFVLSMNAEDHSFSTEISKRCLILYTNASLPDNTETAKALFKSVKNIQQKISTALYREYMSRVLEKLEAHSPTDILEFSSTILSEILQENASSSAPHWCAPVSINQYQNRKYEKIQRELAKLYETNPAIWEVRSSEIILKVPQVESFGLRKEIPDWLLKQGSKGGNIIMDKKAFQEFTRISLKRSWWKLLTTK